MMTKNTSKNKKMISLLLCLPLLLGITYAFANRSAIVAVKTEEMVGYNTSAEEDSFFLPQSIHFEEHSTDATADAEKILQEVMEVLQKFPKHTLIVTGYANSEIGDNELCAKLAKERAENIANILLTKHNVEKGRITTNWEGDEAQPFYDAKKNNAVLFYLQAE